MAFQKIFKILIVGLVALGVYFFIVRDWTPAHPVLKFPLPTDRPCKIDEIPEEQVFEEKVFSETFSDVKISLKLPPGWTRIPDNWYANDNTLSLMHALAGYISPESRAYNQGVTCSVLSNGLRSFTPHDLQYELYIWPDYDYPYPRQNPDVTPQVIGGKKFLTYTYVDVNGVTTYSYMTLTVPQPVNKHPYYVFSFASTVSETMRNSILKSLTFEPL